MRQCPAAPTPKMARTEEVHDNPESIAQLKRLGKEHLDLDLPLHERLRESAEA